MCVVVPACGHNICCRAVTISTVAVAAAVFQLFVCLRINTSVSCRLFVNYRCNNSPAVVITHTKIASFRFVRKELLGLNSPGFCDAQGGAIKVVRFVFVHLFNVVFQRVLHCMQKIVFSPSGRVLLKQRPSGFFFTFAVCTLRQKLNVRLSRFITLLT